MTGIRCEDQQRDERAGPEAGEPAVPEPRRTVEDGTGNPGADPAPADTDPGAEQQRRRRSVPSRLLLAATWLVVLLGCALRVRQWLADRSFWADEAGLWAVIHHRVYTALTRPLPAGQAAPIGWLWSEHLVMSVFGDGERAARFLPLVFGCAGLAVTALLARRLFGPVAALVATFLTAWSPLLVYYSNEFKQYSADVFWSVLLLLLGVVLLDRTLTKVRQVAMLGAGAAVCVWFSHAAVLTAAGVFGALGLLALLGRQWRRLLLLIAASVPLAASIAVEYAVALSKTVANDTLQTFWRNGFPPEPFRLSTFARWLVDNYPRLLDRPLALEHRWLVLALLAAGIVAMAARRPRQLLVLLLPMVVLLAAAILQSYPVSDRLVLFAVPTVLLLVTAPVDLLQRYRWRTLTALSALPAAAALAGVVVLAAPSVQQAVTYARHPMQKEETRAVLFYIGDRFRPGDIILFDQFSLPISVYGTRAGLPAGSARVVTAPTRSGRAGQAEQRLTQRYQRVWLAWGHQFSGAPAATRDGYRARLATVGRKVDSYRATGAGTDLYDLRQPAEDPAGTAPILRSAGARCLNVRGL